MVAAAPIAFLDRCIFTPTSGGTGDWTVSAAVTGYQTPASAGAANGALYHYAAENTAKTEWEIGVGTYNTSGPVLARTTVIASSNGGSKTNFTIAPNVMVTELKESFAAGGVPTFGNRQGTLVASGGETAFDFTSIPPTGKKLTIQINARSSNASAVQGIIMTVNGSTSNLYDWQRLYAKGGTITADQATSKPGWGDGANWLAIAAAGAVSDTPGGGTFTFLDYANTSYRKMAFFQWRQCDNTAADAYILTGHMFWESTVAINQFTISLPTDSFVANSMCCYWID